MSNDTAGAAPADTLLPMLPCPHCGSVESLRAEVGGMTWLVCCDNCGGRGPLGASEGEAIEQWNRRQAPPAPERPRVTCGCGDECPADHYEAAVIDLMGECSNCGAARGERKPDPQQAMRQALTALELARDWIGDEPMMPAAGIEVRAAIERLTAELAAQPAAPDYAELRTERETLLHALAECRDVFPAPSPGDAREAAWAESVGCPESVPAYVRASVEALAANRSAAEPDLYVDWTAMASALSWMGCTSDTHEAMAANPGRWVRLLISGVLKHRDSVRTAAKPTQECEPGEGLTTKQAWWAGYRAGKGLPPDMPRQEALAAAPEPSNEAQSLSTENAYLRERLEAFCADAVRYCWLRDQAVSFGRDDGRPTPWVVLGTRAEDAAPCWSEDLDRAVDEARNADAALIHMAADAQALGLYDASASDSEGGEPA